ncbi:NAD(P)/FAD-dependent oxidoreductase [Staphylococcus agnetis]|uniref:Ferredoxin--NADP reductase n=1 Tax=Staphylococcus agnetis TaxID=985762 RepID=A0ABD7TTU9_9STAP|nr:NAD(P)/FAD-dependent oxidoreductase [Staphylococcus agnetis]UXU55431.1 NAD(P)/FAD-dependent oxidoreductase [Staphylococcus agnetis]UXU57711.1 NAD(P)/FAD-dependent oxidoreductase [Staphylococcus agnetis]UXU64683.1 NAD(P)/FAD-dependent oxidoreductase [Staphylococcus agnetis]UXU67024.1 NAD(P)/FAD-dependent oxidoreductase [Staphylococcus agnetis]
MKDVTIIGGGPAGLYASFYAGVRGMQARLIDAQPSLGGKMRIYPEKIIWDIGGVAPKPCGEIMQDIICQGLHFNPDVHLNSKVVNIEKVSHHHFNVTTESGTTFSSKSIIIAIGGGIITPKKLQLSDNAHDFEYTNLHYAISKYEHFRGKKVLISGGGNSAMDWAQALAPIAKEVILVYRNDSVKGHESTWEALQQLRVQCLPNVSITALHHDCHCHDRIQSVTLQHLETQERMTYPIDAVIVSHGYERQIDLLQETTMPLALTEQQLIAGQGDTRTTVDGVYACGDILTHPSKINLITGAFHDAAHAVNSAKVYISPDDTIQGCVSSHHPAFKEANKQFLLQSHR